MRNENYTVLNNQIFKEKLSLKAVGLLALLLSLPDKSNVSIEYIQEFTSSGKASIRAGIAELEKAGFLCRCNDNWFISSEPVKAVRSV